MYVNNNILLFQAPLLVIVTCKSLVFTTISTITVNIKVRNKQTLWHTQYV